MQIYKRSQIHVLAEPIEYGVFEGMWRSGAVVVSPNTTVKLVRTGLVYATCDEARNATQAAAERFIDSVLSGLPPPRNCEVTAVTHASDAVVSLPQAKPKKLTRTYVEAFAA